MKMKPLLEVVDEIMKDINEAKKRTNEDNKERKLNPFVSVRMEPTAEDMKAWRNPAIHRGLIPSRVGDPIKISSLRDKEFKLCLVLDSQAWFTTQDVTKQWGDDWDDSPYEHNAGPPYEYGGDWESEPYEIKKVYWESDKWVIHHSYKMDSVETINNLGRGGWLAHYYGDTFDEIAAGTTLEEFKKLVDVYEKQ